MVDALGGVEVCVPKPVNDNIGHINLPAGTYNVNGQQALDYVRVRHDISDNGDIGRMKRQQTFLASMANKAVSAGHAGQPGAALQVPRRRHQVADHRHRAWRACRQLAGLAKSLKGIGLDNIQFLTVPFETYPPDPNRLIWAPKAKQLWRRIRLDQPLSNKQSRSTISASDQVPGSPGASPSAGASPTVSPTKAQQRLENGLCA